MANSTEWTNGFVQERPDRWPRPWPYNRLVFIEGKGGRLHLLPPEESTLVDGPHWEWAPPMGPGPHREAMLIKVHREFVTVGGMHVWAGYHLLYRLWDVNHFDYDRLERCSGNFLDDPEVRHTAGWTLRGDGWPKSAADAVAWMLDQQEAPTMRFVVPEWVYTEARSALPAVPVADLSQRKLTAPSIVVNDDGSATIPLIVVGDDGSVTITKERVDARTQVWSVIRQLQEQHQGWQAGRKTVRFLTSEKFTKVNADGSIEPMFQRSKGPDFSRLENRYPTVKLAIKRPGKGGLDGGYAIASEEEVQADLRLLAEQHLPGEDLKAVLSRLTREELQQRVRGRAAA